MNLDKYITRKKIEQTDISCSLQEKPEIVNFLFQSGFYGIAFLDINNNAEQKFIGTFVRKTIL